MCYIKNYKFKIKKIKDGTENEKCHIVCHIMMSCWVTYGNDKTQVKHNIFKIKIIL